MCPPFYRGGISLGQAIVSRDPIFCSDTAFPYESFYRTYSANTGVLVTDSDVAFSPADTVSTGSSGTAPTGTVTFNLHNTATGMGTSLFTDTETLVSGVATSAGYTTNASDTDYLVASNPKQRGGKQNRLGASSTPWPRWMETQSPGPSATPRGSARSSGQGTTRACRSSSPPVRLITRASLAPCRS